MENPDTVKKAAASREARKNCPAPIACLCECGCGGYAKPGNRFIDHHGQRGADYHERQIPKLCRCGCGQVVNPGNVFINGHNARGKRRYRPEICDVCGESLTSDNWSSSYKTKYRYICKICDHKLSKAHRAENIEACHERERIQRRMNGISPMDENRDCSLFLGVYVAEGVLQKVFKNVKQMPNGNVGYDFVCGHGYLVDSKASCMRRQYGKSPSWSFNIGKNVIPDYFVLLAFDNRDDLTPLYIWMMPGNVLNHLTGATISETTIHKWDDYRLDIDKVVACCDTMRK